MMIFSTHWQQFLILLHVSIGSSSCCSSMTVVSYGSALKYQSGIMGVYYAQVDSSLITNGRVTYKQLGKDRVIQYSPLDWWLVCHNIIINFLLHTRTVSICFVHDIIPLITFSFLLQSDQHLHMLTSQIQNDPVPRNAANRGYIGILTEELGPVMKRWK